MMRAIELIGFVKFGVRGLKGVGLVGFSFEFRDPSLGGTSERPRSKGIPRWVYGPGR